MEKNNQGCDHCLGGIGLKYPLFDDERFWIVCDCHPLTDGHIQIITKEHISCMGALDEKAFARFRELYESVLAFLNKAYGKVGIFEHGVKGQTVFHAHMHFLPFDKSIRDIVPERELREISRLDEIRAEFNKNNRYLYVAINNDKWLVDTEIGYPGFFRHRFAKLLGIGERGDWKKTESDPELMDTFEREIKGLKDKWKLRA